MTMPTHATGYLYEFYGLWYDVFALEKSSLKHLFYLPLDVSKYPIQMGEGMPPYGCTHADTGFNTVWFVSPTILPEGACVRGKLTLHDPYTVQKPALLHPIVHEWVVDDWVEPFKGDIWRMIAVPHCVGTEYTGMFEVVWLHLEVEYERVLKRALSSSFLPIEDVCE